MPFTTAAAPDLTAEVGGRAGDHCFPAADDHERHSAPLLLQEPAGLILVVLCLLDDPERHAAPLRLPQPAGLIRL